MYYYSIFNMNIMRLIKLMGRGSTLPAIPISNAGVGVPRPYKITPCTQLKTALEKRPESGCGRQFPQAKTTRRPVSLASGFNFRAQKLVNSLRGGGRVVEVASQKLFENYDATVPEGT